MNYEANTEAIKREVPELTYRVWRVYLAGCAYAFAQHWVSIHQVLVCKAGAGSYLNPTPWSREYMYPSHEADPAGRPSRIVGADHSARSRETKSRPDFIAAGVT